MKRALVCLAAALLTFPLTVTAGELTGTWTLVAADKLLPDGIRVPDYGPAPAGLMMIDDAGHYALQIYDTTRPRFASDNKLTGTAEEYRAASLGASIHYGMIAVDPTAHTITLRLERSSYPNQEGTQQVRHYELSGDTLSYTVPPRANGTIPISVWHRISEPGRHP